MADKRQTAGRCAALREGEELVDGRWTVPRASRRSCATGSRTRAAARAR
jgi:hypothetical protein